MGFLGKRAAILKGFENLANEFPRQFQIPRFFVFFAVYVRSHGIVTGGIAIVEDTARQYLGGEIESSRPGAKHAECRGEGLAPSRRFRRLN